VHQSQGERLPLGRPRPAPCPIAAASAQRVRKTTASASCRPLAPSVGAGVGASPRSAGPMASPSTVARPTCWNRSSLDARAPRWSHSCAGRRPRGTRAPAGGGGSGDALARYDDNGNGRIACKEVRWHGIAPVPKPKRTSPPARDTTGNASPLSELSPTVMPALGLDGTGCHGVLKLLTPFTKWHIFTTW